MNDEIKVCPHCGSDTVCCEWTEDDDVAPCDAEISDES